MTSIDENNIEDNVAPLQEPIQKTAEKTIETSDISLYKSSKPIKMSQKLKYDQKTGRTYNTETMKYYDVKTGMDSDEDYTPEPEPIKNTIQVIKGDSGDTRYTYPVISVNADIDGVAKEIGVKIIFEKRVFGTNLWFTELLVDGVVLDFSDDPIFPDQAESRSEDAFIISEKAQTDVRDFIIRAFKLSSQDTNEIMRELLTVAKTHQNDILSMDETNKRRMNKKVIEEPESEEIVVSLKHEVTKGIGKNERKEDHEIKIRTKLNMAIGKWISTLTVDNKEFPAVTHANSLVVLNEERDKEHFNSKIMNMLNVTAKESQKIMYAINDEAQKQADKFETIVKIYEKKVESARLAKLKTDAERIQKEATNYIPPKLQGCSVPPSYETVGIDGYYGVCGATLHISYDAKGERITKKLCDSQVMVTGYLKNYDSGTDLIEIMFTAPDTNNRTAEWRTIWVSVESIANKEVFKKEILPKGLIVTPKNHDAVMEYLSACINTNFGDTDANCAFHSGSVFEHNGCKNDFTNYVSGERFFTIEGTEVNESKCTYVDTENTEAVRKLSTVGSSEAWSKLASPIIKYPRVRFSFYKAFDVIISNILGVDNCTIGFTWKSSSGKTLTLMLLASGFGNPNRKTGLLITGDISVIALYANLRAYCGHPLFIDDTVNMKEDTKKIIGYIAANAQEPERARRDGKRRGQSPIDSSIFINSELDIFSERAQDGSGNRSIIINKPLMPELNQKLIRDIKNGLALNYGHILKLFLQKVALHRDELRKWFEEAVTRLQATTTELGKKRLAEVFALGEVSGRLLEEIFAEMGLKVYKPAKIVNFMWKECVLNKVNNSIALKALACVYDYYLQHPTNFVTGDSLPNEKTITIDGWDFEKDKYIDWNANAIAKILKDNDFDKNSVYRDWKSAKIIDTNKKGYGKSTFHFLKAGGEKTSMACIRIMKEKVYESLPDVVHPHVAEKREIDNYLDDIRNNVAKGGKPSDLLKPHIPTIMPKPQPVKGFDKLGSMTSVHPERAEENLKEPAEFVEGSGNDW